MVVREPAQLAVAEEVRPVVADVHERRAVAVEERRDDGRPMPLSSGRFWTARMTFSFAFSTAVVSRLPSRETRLLNPNGQELSCPSSVAAMYSWMDSTVMRDATSPAACPPMPSATTNRPRSSSMRYASSL